MKKSLFVSSLFTLVTLALLLLVSGARAQNNTWANTTVGEWNTAGNWSPASVPALGTNVNFTVATASAYSVEYSNTMAATGLGSLFASNTTSACTLFIRTNGMNVTSFHISKNFSATLTNRGSGSATSMTMGQGGKLTFAAGMAFTNSGSFSLSTGSAQGTVANFTNNGAYFQCGGVTMGGSVTLNGGFYINGGTNLFNGTINVNAVNTTPAPFAQGLVINSGIVTMTGLTIGTGNTGSAGGIAGGNITNSGVFTLGTGTASSTRPCAFTMSGGTLSCASSPVSLSLNTAGGVAETVNYLMSGGSLISTGLVFISSTAVTNGTANMTISNTAVAYLNSGGIVQNTGGGAAYNFKVGPGGTLGATANWTANADAAIAAGAAFSFQAADGANNPFSITWNGILSGAGVLTKTGAGVMTLGAVNTFSGGVDVQAGTLKLGIGTGIPAGSGKGDVNLTGTLDLNTVNATINGLTGAGTITNGTGGTGTLTVGSNNVTTVFTGNVVSGTGVIAITKTGSGSVSLNGAGNTYTGDTTVSAGTLILGSQPGSTTFNVASGATLSNTAALTLASGQTLTGSGSVGGNVTANASAIIRPGTAIGTLSLANNLTLNNATNFYQLTSVNTEGGTANDEILVTGNLTLSGTTVISITNTSGGDLANGTYVLVRYSGSLSGSAANLQLAGFTSSSGQTVALSTSTSGEVDLVITGAATFANLTWVGNGGNNFWNINTTSNWFNGTSLSGFSNNDIVTIDDSSTNYTVNLVGTLVPQSITMNTTNNYTFAGTGKISSTAGLTKNNNNTLTVLTTNDTAGSVVITAGTVSVGNGTTSGSLGTGTVANSGSLIVNNSVDSTVANNISGTGAVTKSSSAVVTFSGTSTFSGQANVNVGTYKLGSATALGSAAGATVVANGATVDLNGQTVSTEPVTLNGAGVGSTGALANNSGSAASLSGNISLASAASIGGTGNSTLSGVIGGSGVLTKAGSGTVTLSGVNTNDGKVVVSAGTLSISSDSNLGATPGSSVADQVTLNGGTLKSSASITLAANRGLNIGASGGTLDVTGSFTNNDIITGSGTLTKAGSGTLELSQNSTDHTYGGLILNAGTISINKSTGLGAGNVTINGGVIKTFNTSARSPANNVLFGGDVTLGASGSGTLNFTGNWTITNGNRAVVIDTVAVTNSGNIGEDTAGRALTKSGTGVWTLSGNNTYSGGLTDNGGSIMLAHNNAAGSGTVTYVSGAVQVGDGVTITNTLSYSGTATTDVSLDCPSGTGTWAGTVNRNSASFRPGTSSSAGTLILAGTASQGAGNFIVPRGNVIFTNGANYSATGTATAFGRSTSGTGTSVTLAGSSVCSFGVLNLGGGINSINPITVTVKDTAQLTCSAGNNFDLHNSTLSTATTAVNVDGGTLTVNGFIKTLTGGSQTSTLKLNGGTLKGNANNASFLPALTGLTTKVSTNTSTIDDGGFTLTIASALTHDSTLGATADGGITKAGSGTLTLTANETYTGNTTISTGTLALTGSGAIGSSTNITVAAGATFDTTATGFTLGSGKTLKGNGTVNGAVTANGTIAPGASIGTLTFGAAPTLAGTIVAEINSAASPNADKLVASSGTLTYGGTLTVTNIGGAPTTGDTFDLFDGALAGSFATMNLPPGGTTHWLTANLNVDGTITFTNNTPTISNASVSRAAGLTAKVKKSDLAAADLDGDTLAYTLSTSTNGATITQDATYLYIPANTVNDAFTVTVSDGVGGSASATVTVAIVTATGQTSGNITLVGGNANLTFYGIPGSSYTIQVSPDLSAWSDLSTATVGATGVISYTDTAPPTPNAYYRLRFNP